MRSPSVTRIFSDPRCFSCFLGVFFALTVSACVPKVVVFAFAGALTLVSARIMIHSWVFRPSVAFDYPFMPSCGSQPVSEHCACSVCVCDVVRDSSAAGRARAPVCGNTARHSRGEDACVGGTPCRPHPRRPQPGTHQIRLVLRGIEAILGGGFRVAPTVLTHRARGDVAVLWLGGLITRENSCVYCFLCSVLGLLLLVHVQIIGMRGCFAVLRACRRP